MVQPQLKKKRVKRADNAMSGIARRVARQVVNNNIETKHTFNSFNVSPSSTFQWSQVTPPPVGTGDTQRIGDRYKMKGMNIGFTCAVSDATNIIKFTLIQWFRSSDPVVSDVFEDTSTYGCLCGGYSRDSLRGGQLKVVKEWAIRLATVGPNNSFISNTYVSLRGCKPVQMIGGSATSGMGTLYLVYQSDSTAIGHPAIIGSYTLDYTDA